MDEPFLLPVIYRGVEQEFETSFQVLGYVHRFRVDIEGTEVFFERDEEGQYRAIIPQEPPQRLPAKELLQAIAATIEQLLA